LSTITQLTSKNTTRIKTQNFKSLPLLDGNPQKKGIVAKVVTMTPKKPNSAIRHVAKLNLVNNKRVTTRLPGKGYLCARFNRVVIRAGRANDLPGVRSTLIRGVLDFPSLFLKRKRRSIYGASRPDNYTKHVRRSLRKLGYN
jgi:small subunit ribosomal protein S12